MQAEKTRQTLQVFDIDSYEFRAKCTTSGKELTATKISGDYESLEARSQSDGVDRSVGAVLLVHRLEHVHVLLLSETESNCFRLPGGKISHGEKNEDCLRRTLRVDLAPHDFPEITWRVQDYLGCWWRPQFNSKEMPRVLSQVTRPEESVRLYVMQLPEAFVFCAPETMSLMAVPLFSVVDDAARFGPVIASLPYLVSRLETANVRLLPA